MKNLATLQIARRTQFWLCLSLAFSVIYSWLALQKAFAGEYIVQDDARQHVFWMMRYIDSELFPNDLIADYFQSVAPVGYRTLYHWAVDLGIAPFVFNRLLPLPIALISSYYCFLLCKRIFPVPIGCFITTLLLNQALWMQDDLISATPRAFVYPFFLAFLYYLTKRSLLPCVVAIVLLGIFYPQYVFICGGMLVCQLIEWQGKTLSFSKDSQDYLLCFLGLATAFMVLFPYAFDNSEFAPTITRAQALQLPEFYPNGRSSFFKDHWWQYLVGGGRAGLTSEALLNPATLTFGLFLPFASEFPQQFALIERINRNIRLLPQLIAVSIVMFALAHALLFTLHLPSRYSDHSFRIVLVLAAGITITTFLATLLNRLQQAIPPQNLNLITIGQKLLVLSLTAFLALGTIFYYPLLLKKLPVSNYKSGDQPALYQFFQQQPKNILIASLTNETDYLPSFTQRSILVSPEYAIPYHLGYYRPFRQRATALIIAQYSPDLKVVKQFIRRYGIDFFLIEPNSFTPKYIKDSNWILLHQPAAQKAIERLELGKVPALSTVKDSCSVFASNGFNVVAAECILSK
ncbi:hypothetical protein [Myxosarcina sp. GI1]|uniref:hypothetical protein n=1 Tax=Myxosarcina sp. GI1 TaxID=1541065 RepID=UPI00056CAD7E|nr:hypothetical protein [Myxosarcina sp. GI1]